MSGNELKLSRREYHPTHENLPYGKFSDVWLKTIEEERYYNMEKIASFTVDHRLLDPGIYVSRRDGDITTYDLRTRKPNAGSYMDNVTMHTVEHLFATFVRNSSIKDSVIYFGPMGCRTGFYLLVRGESDETVLSIVLDVLEKICAYDGPVFGASEIECGNYRELELNRGKEECAKYLEVLKSKVNDFKYRT